MSIATTFPSQQRARVACTTAGTRHVTALLPATQLGRTQSFAQRRKLPAPPRAIAEPVVSAVGRGSERAPRLQQISQPREAVGVYGSRVRTGGGTRTHATTADEEGTQAGLPVTWSNPRGEVLTTVVEGALWVAQRPFVWNNIDVGGKMAVVRMADGGLWVHSPVELTAGLRAAVEALGPVRRIVAPNYEHLKWTEQWQRAFPEAVTYGCPGLGSTMRPDLSIDEELAAAGVDVAPEAWNGEIELTHFDCEENPFTGKPFFNEVVFFHGATGTLFTTDAFWNYPSGPRTPGLTKAWKAGMDRVYLPFYRRAMIAKRRPQYDAAVQRLLAWPLRRVLPCHGTAIEGGAAARAAVEAHFVRGAPQGYDY